MVALPADDEHLPQLHVFEEVLRMRGARSPDGAGGDVPGLHEARAGVRAVLDRGESSLMEPSVLHGLLASFLGPRFLERRDLRDLETIVAETAASAEAAPAGTFQSGLLLASHGISLLRISQVKQDLGLLEQATRAFRQALRAIRPGSPDHAWVSLLLSTVLVALATAAGGQDTRDLLAEADVALGAAGTGTVATFIRDQVRRLLGSGDTVDPLPDPAAPSERDGVDACWPTWRRASGCCSRRGQDVPSAASWTPRSPGSRHARSRWRIP